MTVEHRRADHGKWRGGRQWSSWPGKGPSWGS